MIDLKGIAGYNGNFSYKKETAPKDDNKSTEFKKLIGGEVDKISGFQQVSKIEMGDTVENIVGSNKDFIMYDFWGKTIKLELFSGINVDKTL